MLKVEIDTPALVTPGSFDSPDMHTPGSHNSPLGILVKITRHLQHNFLIHEKPPQNLVKNRFDLWDHEKQSEETKT